MDVMLGLLIAAASLAIAWASWMGQRRGGGFKRIHYTAAYEQVVLDRSDDAFFAFQDGPVSVDFEPADLRLIWPIIFKLKLANTGRAPISPEDFSGPLVLRFGEYCNFVAGAIEVNRGPISDWIQARSLEHENGTLKIPPLLLNPRDQLTISGVLNGLPDADGVTISGRISGVETFVRLDPKYHGLRLDAELRPLEPLSSTKHPGLELYVAVGPSLLAIEPDGFSVKLDGVPVQQVCEVSFAFVNHSKVAISAADLVFEAKSGPLRALVRARSNLAGIDHSALDEVIHWTKSRVEFRLGVIPPGGSLGVVFLADGDVSDLVLVDRPSAIQEVVNVRLKVPSDPLGEKLLEMEPRMLLSNRRLHRISNGSVKRISSFVQSLRSARRRMVSDND